jgi:hypothetical protein
MTDIIKPAKLTIMLDASKIDLFETCPRRYHYRHNLNKGLPILQKAKALDIGGLCHSGMEVYYKMLGEGAHFSDRLEAALMKVREVSSNPDSSNSEPEEVTQLIDAIEQSCDYWRAEDENTLEILGVEEPFAYVIHEDDDIRIMISGKIDLIVNVRGIGNNADYFKMPIDHKTFRRDSVVLRKSNQFINYCNAVGSNYLVVNRIGLQKTLSAEVKFRRIPLSYDPLYIKEWKENCTKMILQEYLTSIAEDYWPEKPTSCNKFNRLCEYYEVCDSSGQDAKDFKLENNFVTVEDWDVTKNLLED